MARIAVVCSSRELFGADRSALRLAALLAERGHHAELVLPEGRPEGGLRAEAERRGIPATLAPVTIVSSGGVEGFGALAPRRGLSDYDLEIVNSTAVVAAGIRSRTRVLVVREWLLEHDRRHQVLARWHRRRVEHVVGVSTGVIAQWRALAGSRLPTTVVPNWLEPPLPELVDGPREGIVFLGRFNRWKGPEVLAEAYRAAFPAAVGEGAGEGPSLTFVGAQEHGEFGERARELRAQAQGRRWSVEPFDPNPGAILDRSALLVVPSMIPEPFGTVLLEGLAHGCRVIAFAGGGPDDVGADFPESTTVVPRGPEPLAAALAAWDGAGRPAQSADETERVRDILAERYSPEAASDKWAHVLGHALARAVA